MTTKTTNEVNEILASASTTPLENEALMRLNVLIHQLDGKLKTLSELDEKILNEIKIEDIDKEIEESETISVKVTEAKEKIEIMTRTQATTQNSEIPSQVITSEQGASVTASQARTRLPKLNLPRFKGDITKWNTFWDCFNSAVHSNDALSTIDKFNYLNSLLEGPAARAIQGLTLTETNYQSATELLKERFGKTQQIITAHMDELLRVSSCSGERPSSLRYVYDKISVHVRGLASLGISSEQYGSLLIPIIMSELPSDLRLRVAREAKGEVWEIDNLLDILRLETEAREASERFKVGERPRPSESPPRRFTPSTSRTLVSNEGRNERDFKIRCAYCNAPHYSASCNAITCPTKRKEILLEARRCFKCLRQGHEIKDCRSTKNCRNCSGRHHQSICSKRQFEKSKQEMPEESNEKGNDNNEECKECSTTASTVTAASQVTKKLVLLQTARAIATNEDGTKSTTVRMLFDNGSQRSYLTDGLRSRLRLSPLKSETLHLNTFGDNKYQRKSCQVFKLNLRNRVGDDIQISVLNFPVICSPLPTGINLHDYPHLKGLELADFDENNNQDSIDVLVGSDYYWDFVTGETVRGDFGPTAISSKFGWMLSGPSKLTKQGGEDEQRSSTNLIISSGLDDFQHNNAQRDDQLVQALKQFWETEAIGIKGSNQIVEDANEGFLEEIAFDGQRYEVGLPWKDGSFPSSDNYHGCYNRLQCLHRKLRTDSALLGEYDKIIRDQLERGIVERVPDAKVKVGDDTRVHYLPHHPVVRRDKDTTKVRIVYDGSAKSSQEEPS